MSMIERRIGNYTVTRLLGEGGMGAVYLGEHPLIGKKVAVKVLHDELAQHEDIVQRFFIEARAVNDIHHENIVDIVDFGKSRDPATGREQVYFLMELLEGESLQVRLRSGLPSPAEVCHVIAQCASALAASHAHDIVHRDIKPDNIFLTTRGPESCFVKLLDFGIAKLTGAHAAPGMTRAGAVIGTPAYMSPEQCDGAGDIDWRSDIYSLGVVMYEMLCGRTPFVGGGFAEILVGHLTLPPPPPSEHHAAVPPALEAIALRCLEKDRTRRFQSMDQLRAALSAFEQAPGPSTAPSTAPRRATAHNAPTRVQPAPLSSTTLSGLASELRRPPVAAPARKRSAAFAIAGSVALAAGVAAALVPPSTLRRAATAATQPALPTDGRDTVQIAIDSTPRGATITRAGSRAPLGVTPHTMTVGRGAPPLELRFSLDGYRPEARTLRADRDSDLVVALAPAGSAETEASPGSAGGASKGSSVARSRHGSHSDLGFRALPDLPRKRPGHGGADLDGVLVPKL